MKLGSIVCVAAILSSAAAFADGISLIVQDDYFTGTDRGYTDGTELMWSWSPADTNSPIVKSALGVRNRMYTPDSIEAHTLLPTERPYCATLSTFYQQWRREDDELVKYEIEAGVLGPDAMGDQLQTSVHHLIKDTIPQGWDGQLRPDEPILNLYMERWHPFGLIGEPEAWQARLDGVYGGAFGTTFINAEGGVCAKAGWNIPADAAGGTVLANKNGGWFAFLFVEPRCWLVAHNATLGSSFFYDRDNERDLAPVVGDAEGGITVGIGGLSLSYSDVTSTREFTHQNHKQSYGNVRIDYTWSF
jgi:lipid A 3-O-deacylase